ncbi:MAG: putative metalloprotease CJM1_0395 family protein [bacterium]|nr:putative metalloprotease CJM1_0395 family protein [bacterium]
MRVAAASSYIPRLSANQWIGTVSRTRGAAQPSRVNPVDSFEAVEETDNQFTKTKRTVPRTNIGPSVADLTPSPSSQRPQGFFSNEFQKAPKDPTELDGDQQNTPKSGNQEELSEDDQKKVKELKERDAEVVAHEQAHKAVAGALSPGPIHYDYTQGPDKVNYRTGGHVNISTSEGKTPEETLSRAETIQRAALAPAEPSNQDRAVAAEAAQMAAQARQEIAEERIEDEADDKKTDEFEAKLTGSGEVDKSEESTDSAEDVEPTMDDVIEDLSSTVSKGNKVGRLEDKVPEFQMRKALAGYAAMTSSSLFAPQFNTLKA